MGDKDTKIRNWNKVSTEEKRRIYGDKSKTIRKRKITE